MSSNMDERSAIRNALLVLVPTKKCWISDLLGRSAGTLEDDAWRHGNGSINIAKEVLSAQDGNDLSLPQEEVFPSEARGDEVGYGGDG